MKIDFVERIESKKDKREIMLVLISSPLRGEDEGGGEGSIRRR